MAKKKPAQARKRKRPSLRQKFPVLRLNSHLAAMLALMMSDLDVTSDEQSALAAHPNIMYPHFAKAIADLRKKRANIEAIDVALRRRKPSGEETALEIQRRQPAGRHVTTRRLEREDPDIPDH